jgi:hypothetical protein
MSTFYARPPRYQYRWKLHRVDTWAEKRKQKAFTIIAAVGLLIVMVAVFDAALRSNGL